MPVSNGFWTGLEFNCWDPGSVPYDKLPTISLVLPVNSTTAFKLVVSAQVICIQTVVVVALLLNDIAPWSAGLNADFGKRKVQISGILHVGCDS